MRWGNKNLHLQTNQAVGRLHSKFAVEPQVDTSKSAVSAQCVNDQTAPSPSQTQQPSWQYSEIKVCLTQHPQMTQTNLPGEAAMLF